MEKNLNDLVKEYLQMYSSTFPAPPARLPYPLFSEEDTRCRLMALFQLEVQARGREFIDDENIKDKVTRVARWLWSSTQRGLLLIGSMGNGKSTMIRAIHHLFKKDGSLGNAQEIFDYCKSSQGSLRYWDEPLLLIDDMGCEPRDCCIYGEQHYPLSRILLHRYNKQLTTIIATNLGIEDIAARYGDRVVDRMNETYSFIKYTHASYR